MTLTELFEEYSANRSDLTRKCAANMRQRMQKYVLPALGARDIEGIRVSEIYRLLQEIREKNETARQLINYVGQCYTFAAALEYTSRSNPAPALRQLMRLPAIKDHYPALGYQQLGELRVLFEDKDGKQQGRNLTVTRQAVLMALYSLLRIGECAALKWAWVNQDTNTIEIPREHMKMRRDFRIPVTPQIAALLEHVKAFQESSGIESEFVFSVAAWAGPGWPSTTLTSQSRRPASRMSNTMPWSGHTAGRITWNSAGRCLSSGTSTSMSS